LLKNIEFLKIWGGGKQAGAILLQLREGRISATRKKRTSKGKNGGGRCFYWGPNDRQFSIRLHRSGGHQLEVRVKYLDKNTNSGKERFHPKRVPIARDRRRINNLKRGIGFHRTKKKLSFMKASSCQLVLHG